MGLKKSNTLVGNSPLKRQNKMNGDTEFLDCGLRLEKSTRLRLPVQAQQTGQNHKKDTWERWKRIIPLIAKG